MIHPPPENSTKAALRAGRRGFTLIEMSMVLVVIGLIVGGVLVGQDLIKAAQVRATVTQLEQFNSATNTFYGKYNALPGDIPASLVSQLGFTASPVRAGTAGQGDGNGELDGTNIDELVATSWNENGENLFFWEDLSINSKLIEETVASAVMSGGNCTTQAACSVYFPPAKIGGGNVVYVYSGYAKGCCAHNVGNGPNFFGLSLINSNNDGSVGAGSIPPAPGLTVVQAYAIDTKIDDGMPTTGQVLAQYLGNGGEYQGVPVWAASGGVAGKSPGTAASGSSTTCYDNGNNAANPMQYSTEISNGTGVNCALSFQMQGAAR